MSAQQWLYPTKARCPDLHVGFPHESREEPKHLQPHLLPPRSYQQEAGLEAKCPVPKSVLQYELWMP